MFELRFPLEWMIDKLSPMGGRLHFAFSSVSSSIASHEIRVQNGSCSPPTPDTVRCRLVCNFERQRVGSKNVKDTWKHINVEHSLFSTPPTAM